jgi:hypothetical protein
MKKMLFLMVALLTSVGICAFEVDGIYYSVVSEDNHTAQVTGYNFSYDGDLILNGTVTYNSVTYNVVFIGSYAFQYCTSLTSVGDLSACTYIGPNAFSECSSLTSVGDLSACTYIGDYAFQYCTSLTSVGDLSACTYIGAYAFQSSNLTSIGDLSACTTIEANAFYNCSSLTSIGDLSVCTSIGHDAFTGIEKVTISNSTPPTLTGNPCGSMTTFIVPAAAVDAYCAADYWADIKFQIIADNATTEYDVNAPLLDGIGANNLTNVMKLKVTGDIDSEDIMFIRNNMVNLHHLDLTDANYKASDNEYASGKRTADNSVGGLYGLLRLRSVKLPTSAKSIEGDAFYNCAYLKDVNIPEGIERIEDGWNKGAFGSSAIKSITMPNSLTYIGMNAFSQCHSLSNVSFSPNLKGIGQNAFCDCNELSSVILPTSLSVIGNNAFQSVSKRV